MNNRTIHRTALSGRLFLCPEIVTHHARPPPGSVQAINQPSKGGQLMYYHTCPYCGAWYLRFKLSRRDGLHWSFARCTEPATPEADAKWDKQKAALLERMKRKANKE